MSRLFFYAMTASLGLATSLLGGCEQIWGTEKQPNAGNCVINLGSCASGQHCNYMSEVCEPNAPDMSVIINLPPPPTSYISPGGLVGNLTFPRNAVYWVAAQAPATIYYTTNGNPPTPGSGGTSSGDSPLVIGLLGMGTTLRWFADYGPNFAPEAPHSFVAFTDLNTPDTFGYIPQDIKFDLTQGPVVVVAPGTTLTGSVRFEAWQSNPTGFCPNCALQYVVSVASVGAVGCVDNINLYGAYPGMSNTLFFSFKAPNTPGRYPLISGMTQQSNCDGSTSNGPDIGEVIVQ